MKTKEVIYYSKCRICLIYIVAMVLLYQVSGCTSVPQSLKGIGAKLLEQCPKDISLDKAEQSVLLASIETDLMLDELFLLLEKDTGAKYLMMLRPKKFGMPTGDVIKHGRFSAKPFCYVTSPGNYHIKRIIGVLRIRGPAGTSEENIEYKHEREFTLSLDMVTYLGRYILLDHRMKNKGYFGRMGTLMSGMFTGSLVPRDIEINITNNFDKDSAWLLEEHKQIRHVQVINVVP